TEKYEKGNEKEWFFISERTKLGKGGGRGGRQKKRGSNGGYWSATVAAKKINAGNGIVGYKTILDYYVGKQPNGVKGDWLMQEYWLESSSSDDDHNNENKVDHALCKIYLTPRGAKKKKKSEEE
ncbi:PREDICTED: NAC transcription factor 29-like, partial [Camelina sativa]|uniref:NAC transcription factor 29-like n=1 Tax=Camelina sativa TaxID=90675 RepID=A0ABM0Y9K2_CAMSA